MTFASRLPAALALALSLGVAGQASADSLTTTFTTDNYGRSGLYFDLTAAQSITISDFIVNGDAGNWSVWYKSGTYAGSETDASAWTLLGTGVTSTKIDTLHVGGLTIGAGQTDGIYIWNASGYQYYNNDTATYTSASGALTFSGGTGNYGIYYGIGPFNNTLANRVWSGTVEFSPSAVPETGELSMMLLGLGVLGAVARRRSKAA